MTSSTSPTMSNHSPIQYDGRIQTSHPKYQYPPIPTLQRPPATYNIQSKRQSEVLRSDPKRIQGSVSSADSGSSSISGAKQYPTQYSYWHAPSVEQGLMTGSTQQSWNPAPCRGSSYPPSRQEMAETNTAMIQYIEQQQRIDDEEEKENDHAIWILFWLSCLDPIHSLISAIYTVLVVFTLALVSPIRLCQKHSSFGDQIIRSLAPIHKHHLEMLKAPSVENAFTFEYKSSCLVAIHLTSPFLSMGVMVASWISAAFWLFALLMGNPDGTERRDDGRDTVILVRNWWERYLLNAIK